MSNADASRRRVRYFDSNIPVLPGDKVFRKGWFRRLSGEIIYVPGVSDFNGSFHEGGYGDSEVTSCGVKFESGKVIGEVIYPETGQLRETIAFVSRGEQSFTDLSALDEE